jgi:uncharacterized tellurite resistance protein B-like protein
VTQLPPRPDFAAIEAAAHQSVNRRTLVLALIGNLVYSWSNNESMFIYVLMLLMDTDETSAAVVFATLNTTRARIDLIERLASIKIKDKTIDKALERIVARFHELTRIRNEFNHCMYTVGEHGEITHTHAIRLQEVRGQLQLGVVRKMDDARIQEMLDAIRKLTRLNRDIWDFLPRLKAHLDAEHAHAGSQRGAAT